MKASISKQLAWSVAVILCGIYAGAPAVAEKTVLRLWVTGSVNEAPSEDAELAVLFGGEKARTLYQWVDMIHEAAESDEVAGLVLIIDSPQFGLAQVEDLRQAVLDFRKAGKPVHAYLDHAGNGAYALATAADHITLAPKSALDITGIGAEISYYKGMFDKIGVEADILHCGDYKSAVEPYTRTEPTKYAAEQMNRLLDGLFEQLVRMFAEGRGLTADEITAAIDAAPLTSEKALELKLVDEVSGFPAFRRLIKKEYGSDVKVIKSFDESDGLDVDFENPFAIFQLFQDLMEKAQEEPEPGIGLIYIEGAIMVGKSQGGFMSGQTAGSTSLRAALTEALEDDNIKAVVIRVNSPGGSVLASDIMWDAATRIGESKPLIVSMGNVAASGGYYVAIPGEVIFAQPTTITGSIGVFGGKLVWNQLWEEKIGITTTEFTRGKNAALFSMNHKFSDEERVRMQQWLDDIYAAFKGRVMESRGERIKGDLEKLAGGRVYTGTQALEIGLIDKIGGLSDAIAYATERSGLADPAIHVLPREKDFMDVLMTLFDEDTEDEFEISMRPLATTDPMLRAMLPVLKELAGDRVDSLLHGWRNMMIIQREHVGCFLPFSGKVR